MVQLVLEKGFHLEDLKDYTLLVVDDEEMLRKSIVMDLQRKGFTVLSAENGGRALELVKINKVDLVISDVRMPGGDGLKLLEDIRVQAPKLPVFIFLTGYSDIREEDVIAKGATKILAKPFERKVLMALIYQSLGIDFVEPKF